MTNQPDRPVNHTGRPAEIAERYGAEHLVVQCSQRAHDYLTGAVERTQERMWAAGLRDQ
jgi:hypothetical protein